MKRAKVRQPWTSKAFSGRNRTHRSLSPEKREHGCKWRALTRAIVISADGYLQRWG
jgi:hypothetical protein